MFVSLNILEPSVTERVPRIKESWMFITPPMPKFPTHCKECGDDLAKSSTVVNLYSGSYCEKCYNYWYSYKNYRYTPHQAIHRELGWWPNKIVAGDFAFTKPKKGNKRYGKRWMGHPIDSDEVVLSVLDPESVLIDGVTYPPEVLAENKEKLKIMQQTSPRKLHEIEIIFFDRKKKEAKIRI